MKIFRTLLSALFFVGVVVCELAAQIPAGAKIDPQLELEMVSAPEAYHDIFILLTDRFDVAAFRETQGQTRSGGNPAAIAPALLPALQEHAERTQAPLLQALDGLEGVKPSSVHSFWVNNLIFLEAKSTAIAQLSSRDDVAAIGRNVKAVVPQVDAICFAEALPPAPNSIEPGLAAINAPAMWALGYTGYGRRAMIIDSGQDPAHPSMFRQFAFHNLPLEQVWSGNGEAGFCGFHGVHVAGTVIGLDRFNNDTIGVAFNGSWFGGPANLGGTGGCTDNEDPSYLSLIGNLQWALNPDDDFDTTDDVPDAVNNSWGFNQQSCTESENLFNGLVQVYDELGIALIFSAGNDGPGAGTVGAPNHVEFDDINIFSVGAVNANSGSFPIAGFSARGPTPCDTLAIKPEVVAPGVNVRSALPNETYGQLGGTSMAAPHVTGAVLLLKEAFPDLPGKTLLNALYQSAIDLGDPGEDNVYGRGMIDVFAAYQYLVGEGFVPAPPIDGTNDVLLIDFEAPAVSCQGVVPVSGYVENAGQDTLRRLEITFTEDPDGDPLTVFGTWMGALAPGERAWLDLGAYPASIGETMDIQVTLSNPNGRPDLRNLDNALKKIVRVSDLAPVPAGLVEEVQVCKDTRVLLTSAFEGMDQVAWYDAAEGGNLLAEGDTALLVADTRQSLFTVYAESTITERIGLPAPIGRETFSSEGRGLIFDCFSPFVLKSVKMVAERSGIRLLRLERPDGTSRIFPVSVPEGESRVELDLEITPGEGYVLELQTGAPLMHVLVNPVGYPFTIADVVNIRTSTNGPLVYNYFFDWEVEYLYPCGRTPVAIPVNTLDTAPMADFVFPRDTIATGEPVNFTDASSGPQSWQWQFGDGNGSNRQNPAHIYTEPGVYRPILTITGANGCTDTALDTLIARLPVNTQAQNNLQRRLQLLPNPTRDEVWLTLDRSLDHNFQTHVTDVFGRTVLAPQNWEASADRVLLNLESLPAGTYFIVLRSRSGRAARRVVKM